MENCPQQKLLSFKMKQRGVSCIPREALYCSSFCNVTLLNLLFSSQPSCPSPSLKWGPWAGSLYTCFIKTTSSSLAALKLQQISQSLMLSWKKTCSSSIFDQCCQLGCLQTGQCSHSRNCFSWDLQVFCLLQLEPICKQILLTAVFCFFSTIWHFKRKLSYLTKAGTLG